VILGYGFEKTQILQFFNKKIFLNFGENLEFMIPEEKIVKKGN